MSSKSLSDSVGGWGDGARCVCAGKTAEFLRKGKDSTTAKNGQERAHTRHVTAMFCTGTS